MFPWNIAKSAEAMFSRWAIKRVCKFLLKKKLGKFILGEIDLNQLDVQLSAGTVQLSDLALNVDYINQKLGAAAAVTLKEGSIGTLLVKLPWKGDACQIELDELELVIVPCGRNAPVDGPKTNASGECDNYPPNREAEKLEQERVTSDLLSSMDVHEGVKTVAKMVKWLLSSFHVKVSKLIVAFDASEEKQKNKRYCRTLVLRMAEVECGTHISGDAQFLNEPREDDFLGLSRLTNFLKFQGAVIEYLQIDGVENQTSNTSPLGTSYSESASGSSQATAMIPIVTGKHGGFSGHIKLSIPWKNGVLDIRRVDADAYIDPLELRFQPSTITSSIYLWEIFRRKRTGSEDQVLCSLTDSLCDIGGSAQHSSTPQPCSLGSDMAENECSVGNGCSLLEEEYKRDPVISESHFISDWVGRSQKVGTCAESDFGMSVDQFFECFDELRSSQSALGNSGMWNWTSSVFTAITAASNLASGSLHIPSEQQHVETNFKATVAGISLLFSFFDEDPMQSCGGMHDQAKVGSNVRYLGAEIQGLLLVLQVCPREMNFEAKVEHVEIDDNFFPGNDATDLKLRGPSNCTKSHSGLIRKIQDGIQGALAPFCSSTEDAWIVNWSGYDAEFELGLDSESTIQNVNHKGIYRDDVVKVSLLKTLGISHLQVTVNSQTSDNVFMGPTSFTLKLPPFVLWVNFGIIDIMSDLLKQIESSEISGTWNNFESGIPGSQKRSDSEVNETKGTCSRASSISSNESLRGSIFLSNARIILCFPYKNGADSGGYSFFDQFIALHFSSPKYFCDKKVGASIPASAISSRKGNMLQCSRSLHLNLGNLGAYLITSDAGENAAGESGSMVKLKFSAQKIMSIVDQRTGASVISMYWQDAFTGPQIIKRAKVLATAGNLTRNRYKGEDYEFAPITAAKDMEDLDTLTRQDIILSSGFVFHAKLSHVNIDLEKSQYDDLIFVLRQLNDNLPCMDSGPINQGCPSQGSVLVECEAVEVAISMEVVESVKVSIQKELPGSWHSFRLKIQNFELLSVSNIGGIKDASFLWVVHREGTLSGSVTGVPDEEMLLISCSNSTMGRGDGEGSNVLSPRCSGSDIVHLWHPEDLHSYMSIAVRCGTIVAVGGRLDWWDSISSFFILSSREIEQAGDQTLQERNSEEDKPAQSSFVLSLLDVALSYEPYFYYRVDHEGSVTESCSASTNNAIDEQLFACLLAASSLRLTNSNVSNSSDGEYKIQAQDLGLLLCPVSGPKAVGGAYDVEHLRVVGYLKIAQETHFGAVLRTFSEQEPLWEVESLDTQIVLNTCHDTAAGFIRLCAQLQQLFAPDVEDTIVHLQNRWNNVKRASEETGKKTFDVHAAPSTTTSQDLDTKPEPRIGNLMDEICEDAFILDAGDYQGDYHDQHLHMSFDDSLLGEPSNSSVRYGEHFSGCFPFGRSVPVSGLENDGISTRPEKSPELIEEYFLSDLRPLSELSSRDQSSQFLDHKTGSFKEIPVRNTGWYGDTSLRILENHISDVKEQTNLWRLGGTTSSNQAENDSYGKIKGRMLFKNMNVVWRVYAGSDWNNFKKRSAAASGRDTTVCLEISLLGMKIQYDIFPSGGICVSRLSLSIQDFFMKDNSKNSPWKLVLGYYESKDHPRKSSAKAFKLDLESVLPDPSTPLEEYRLRVAFLPMRLHLHQSQLDFLINFFGGTSVESSQSATQESCEIGKELRKSTNFGGHTIVEEALLPYFQKFDIGPVLLRVDYSPNRVDLAALSGGKYVELVNLVPWKGVELELKHVQAVGVYGWSSVCETVIGEWLEDISQTQIHKLLKGLPPIRSLVAVGSGAAKLVTLPVHSYRKDKRLLKGMQRGTVAFLRSISREAIGLGVHLAAGAHDILLQAEYIVTSIPPSVSWSTQSRGNINVRSNQPKDARQGIKQAYESIGDGLGKSASALVRTPLKRYQRSGSVGSALATAVHAAPMAAMAPAAAAARAMHYALLGVRNSLDPEHKKESLEKYLGTNQHREFMQ